VVGEVRDGTVDLAREVVARRAVGEAPDKYPDSVRRSFSTTNLVEAVNGQLEIMRRNSGGYFQSEDAFKLKLGMAVTHLETGTWRRVAVSVDAALDQLNAIFESRLEVEP